MDDIYVSVVIPVYNEEPNLRELHQELTDVLRHLTSYEIIYVDDGSTDGSFSVLRHIFEDDEHVSVVRFRKNFGQSAALSAGFDRAVGEVIVSMDADLQNDPRDIPRLLDALRSMDVDVVCGWRTSRRDVVLKRVLSWMSNALRRKLTREDIHDSGCTLRAYKRICVQDLPLMGDLHRYIPALIYWSGYRVGEIRVNHRHRRAGKTKYNWRRLGRGFLDLLTVACLQRFQAGLNYLPGLLALTMIALGLLPLTYMLIVSLMELSMVIVPYLLIISTIMLTGGVMLLCWSLMVHAIIIMFSKRKKPYIVESVLKR